MTASGKYPRYRPSPFLIASIVTHVVTLAGLALRPHFWPYLVGIMVADHASLAVGGFLPRSSLLGPNVKRLPDNLAARGEVALTIDDGPNPEVTPSVLDNLAQYDAKASFFCVGDRVRRFPRVVSEAFAQGHTIENHTWSHPNGFALLPPSRLSSQIDRAQDAIGSVIGKPPQYFRAPAGIRSPWLEPVLHQRRLRLTSWTRRGFDTVSTSPSRVTNRLLDGLAPGDVLLLHDGPANVAKKGEHMILSVLPRLLEEIKHRGLKVVSLP